MWTSLIPLWGHHWKVPGVRAGFKDPRGEPSDPCPSGIRDVWEISPFPFLLPKSWVSWTGMSGTLWHRSRQAASSITHRIQRNTSLLSLSFFFPLQSPPSPFYFSLLIRVGESEKPAHPQPVPSCQILEQHSQFLLGVRNRLWKQKLIQSVYWVRSP